MNANQVVKKNKKGTEYIEDLTGSIIAKRCSMCGEMKGLEHFSNNGIGLGGAVSRCKPCVVKYTKEYPNSSKRNNEKKKENDRRYYERNKEKIREKKLESTKKYYQENRELILERAKERYRRKKETLHEQSF